MSTVDWIPVTERLPEAPQDSEEIPPDVLCWFGKWGGCTIAYYDHDSKTWRDQDWCGLVSPTHWAEMPKGPS